MRRLCVDLSRTVSLFFFGSERTVSLSLGEQRITCRDLPMARCKNSRYISRGVVTLSPSLKTQGLRKIQRYAWHKHKHNPNQVKELPIILYFIFAGFIFSFSSNHTSYLNFYNVFHSL